MCPSYHATLDEYDSTRGRANLLRETITRSRARNPFDDKELIKILDRCLSCKSCKSECPSNVDMATYKAEVYQQYYLARGTPPRASLTASYATLNRFASKVPRLSNFFANTQPTSSILKFFFGFSQKRKLPQLQSQTLRKWAAKNLTDRSTKNEANRSLVLFCDEFTNYNDTETGKEAILLLTGLGYNVIIAKHDESGRAAISKGLLKKARKLAQANVTHLHPIVDENTPLVGIEPSAILCFRDEYPSLLRGDLQEQAKELSENTFTFEEFISRETDKGRISPGSFRTSKEAIYYHSHCHQKALSSINCGIKTLSILPGSSIQEIDCGCCGMAGSFGFEKEHYQTSMEIAELSLFPAIRNMNPEDTIAVSGTSCRQQILDGTGRQAVHPAQVLYRRLQS